MVFTAPGMALLGLAILIILRPFVQYFRDTRGFRKYPTQNFLSGLTALAYNWEIGRRHSICRSRRLYNLHQKKGPVIRVAPDWLSFGSAAAVKDIYGHRSPLSKNEVYYVLQENGQHLANMTSKPFHSDRRHLVAASYAPRNIESWEPKISTLAEVLLGKLDSLCTIPLAPDQVPEKSDLLFDGNRWGLMFAFEGVGRIGLSAELNFIDQGSDLFELRMPDGSHQMINALKSVRGYYGAVATIVWDTPRFRLLKNLSGAFSRFYAEAWAHGDHWRGFLTQLVEDRLVRYDSGEVLEDLFQPMLEDRKTGDAPDVPKQDKVAEMDQMFTGAIDGTGSSLVNTLYYLVKYPDTLKRARDEVDAALSPDDEVAPWSKVKSLLYLKACIDEAQRLSPGVAGDLPRKTPAEESYTVDGVTVPGGTNVSISAFTAQRDPEIFPDPEAYKPERWLIKGGDQLKKMLDVYLVFTMGSRSCMGKSVTILIQMVYLATLLHRYDFALETPDWELSRTEYFNMWPCELPLKIWRRRGQKPVTNGSITV